MRWILDDGPLGHLATIVHSESLASWEAGVLLVAGATAQAASPKTRALLDSRVDDRPLVGRFDIRLSAEDPAFVILNELHPNIESTQDLAEHESIAWAQTHQGRDAVFVCADRRAALTALAELGHGRVAHPFDTWLDLLEREWLTKEEFEKLCKLTHKHDQGLPRLPGRVAQHLS